KFVLFVHDTFEPVTFLAAGFNAGLDQAENQDPTFGQGGAGYGKRFGANFADQASFKFFRTLCIPRYFRRTRGTTAWLTAAAGGAYSTRWSTCSWPTTTMASACSIFPNCWERQALSC